MRCNSRLLVFLALALLLFVVCAAAIAAGPGLVASATGDPLVAVAVKPAATTPAATASTDDEALPSLPAPGNAHYPDMHRPDFVCPELKFITEGFLGDFFYDPDAVSYTGEDMTIREQAWWAMRHLYDLTGWLPEKAVVVYDGFDLLFGHKNPWNGDCFFSARIMPDTGRLMGYQLTIDKEYPPYSSDIVVPEGFKDMTLSQIALYFYKNSAFGGREHIVDITKSSASWGDDGTHLYLCVNDEECYEVDFWDTELRIPERMWGLYEIGYEH